MDSKTSVDYLWGAFLAAMVAVTIVVLSWGIKAVYELASHSEMAMADAMMGGMWMVLIACVVVSINKRFFNG